MKRLISAIQFITILPAGKTEAFDPKGMAGFFPVVGILIGFGLALFDTIVSQLWFGPVPAILDVIFLVLVTGAFHLDGLGDTADGLYGGSSKKKALEIMKDSRVGVMGLTAIICCLAVKWGSITCITTDDRMLLLAVIPAYARGSMLFGFRFLEYGRDSGGTGSRFFEERIKYEEFWGLLLPIVLSFFLGWKGVLLNLCFVAATFSVLMFYKRKIGCITGDMLGAMVEVNEAVLFLVMAVNF